MKKSSHTHRRKEPFRRKKILPDQTGQGESLYKNHLPQVRENEFDPGNTNQNEREQINHTEDKT